MNEKEFIEKLREKDPDAVKLLIKDYNRRLYSIIYRVVNNYEDADDIIQEVWLKFFSSIYSFKSKSSVYTYLYRIALNEAINWQKKKNRYFRFLLNIKNFKHSNNYDPVEKVIKKEENELLKKAIDLLPSKQKKVFILKEEGKLSYKEIGDIMKIKENNAKVLHYHAVNKIKDILENMGVLK